MVQMTIGYNNDIPERPIGKNRETYVITEDNNEKLEATLNKYINKFVNKKIKYIELIRL